jgi:hypothetical protein
MYSIDRLEGRSHSTVDRLDAGRIEPPGGAKCPIIFSINELRQAKG